VRYVSQYEGVWLVSGCVVMYCVSAIKQKTPDQNDLKLGTLVILNTMSKPIDLGFKTSRIRGTWTLERYKVIHLTFKSVSALLWKV